MTPNHATLKIITAWVTRLADVTAHRDQKPSADAIATYAAVLCQSHVSGAFTVESLAHVTAQREWFPAVSVASSLIAEWWRDHRPASAPKIADDRSKPDGWDQRDAEWLDFWHRRCREIGQIGHLAHAEFQRTRLASLIQQMSPRAWIVIDGPRPGRDMPPKLDGEAVERVLRGIKGGVPGDPQRPSQRRENAFLSDADVEDMRNRAGIRHVGVVS